MFNHNIRGIIIVNKVKINIALTLSHLFTRICPSNNIVNKLVIDTGTQHSHTFIPEILK